MRKRNPALRTGDINVLTEFIKTTADQFVLAWRRKLLEKEVLTFLNLSSHEHEVILMDEKISGIYTNIFDATTIDFYTNKSIQMQPWQSIVVEK